jgi:oxygen-independent coproporphyrinogen-3 oxidase
MGVSAISGIGDAYAQNYRDLPGYERAVAARGIGTMRGYRLSADDRLRRAVIGRLLCHTVIRKREIESEFAMVFDEYFAPELERLAVFAEDGLIVHNDKEIRATMLGRIFIRNIAMVFDPYLEQQKLDTKPLFSRTL